MKQAPIQWDEIRKRLQANEDSLRGRSTENPNVSKPFFVNERPTSQGACGEKARCQGIPALIFRLAQERYAIALKELAEVLPFTGCAQVPGGSPQFLGVINLRGELRPVIDLAWVLSGGPFDRFRSGPGPAPSSRVESRRGRGSARNLLPKN